MKYDLVIYILDAFEIIITNWRLRTIFKGSLYILKRIKHIFRRMELNNTMCFTYLSNVEKHETKICKYNNNSSKF